MRSIHSPDLIGIPPKGNSDFDMHCLISCKDVSVPKPVRNLEKIVVRDGDRVEAGLEEMGRGFW